MAASNIFRDLYSSENSERIRREQSDLKLAKRRDALWQHWKEHPWDYLTGVDPTTKTPDYPDGVPVVFTQDEIGGPGNIIKPYPKKRHLRYLVDVLLNEKKVLVDKGRQMMVSWTALLVMDYLAGFGFAPRCLWSKVREEDAKEMLRDKPRFTARQQAQNLPWVAARFGRTDRPATRIDYASGAYILGCPQNVADNVARGGTASIIGIDEAARQDRFKSIVEAALPMGGSLWAFTTASFGSPGGDFFKLLIDEGRERPRTYLTIGAPNG